MLTKLMKTAQEKHIIYVVTANLICFLLIYFKGPLILIGILMVLAIFFLIFANPFVGYLLILPAQLIFLGINQDFSYTKIIPAAQLLLLFGLLLFRKFYSGNYKIAVSKNIKQASFLFAMFLILSLPVSLYKGNALIDWLREISRFWNYFLYFLAVASVRSKKEARITIVWIFLFLLLSAVSGTVYWMAMRKFIDTPPVFVGVFGTHFSSLFLFFASISWLIHARKKSLNNTFIACGVGLFSLAMILATGTRSGLLSILLTVLFIAGFQQKARHLIPRWVFFGTLLFLIALILVGGLNFFHIPAVDGAVNRILSVGSGDIFSDLGLRLRLIWFQNLPELIQNTPLFGKGVGYLVAELPLSQRGLGWFPDNYFDHPFIELVNQNWEPTLLFDNSYVYLITKFGLVGTSVFVFFYVSILVELRKLSKKRSDIQYILIVLQAMMIVEPILMFFGSTFMDRLFQYILVTVLAIAPYYLQKNISRLPEDASGT